jgi:uncharacterized protein (TIGR02594 family)
MPKWRITAEFQPRSSASRFAPVVHKVGDPRPFTVHEGDLIDGVEESRWIKTHFDGVSPDEVFIQILDHAELDAPLAPEPIRSDERDAFCALVTTMARHYETDRNYLIAWAFLDTNNLQELGQPGDGKIGPFQFSAEEWDAAIKGPAKVLNLSAMQRRGWRDQILVAVFVLKDCVERLQAALGGEMPTRLEVYFAQKFGLGAEEVLKPPATDRCRDRIKNAPAAGTFAAALANSDKTIQEALDDLRGPLEGGFKAAYTLIDTQPPEIRFFDESDLPPAAGDSAPWLKVATDEMNRGVTRDANDKNTADIQAYFKVTGTPDPDLHEAWCAAFVSFCMKNSGVAEVESSMKSVSPLAMATSWKYWGKPAPVPHPIGCVVVLKPVDGHGHVGFLWEGSNQQTIQLLGGNQKKRGEDHNHVGVVPFSADRVAENGYRWVDLAPVSAAVGGVGAAPARWDGKTPRAGDWSRFVMDALDQRGAQLLACEPSDIRDFCPAFPADKARRARFWLFLLSCVAEFESDFDPNQPFIEPSGEVSAGLLQLSIGDAGAIPAISRPTAMCLIRQRTCLAAFGSCRNWLSRTT